MCLNNTNITRCYMYHAWSILTISWKSFMHFPFSILLKLTQWDIEAKRDKQMDRGVDERTDGGTGTQRDRSTRIKTHPSSSGVINVLTPELQGEGFCISPFRPTSIVFSHTPVFTTMNRWPEFLGNVETITITHRKRNIGEETSGTIVD